MICIMLNIMYHCIMHVYSVRLQTKAVQQSMDQKNFHRAVELRGRLVVACSDERVYVFYMVRGCCSNTLIFVCFLQQSKLL